MLCNMLTSSGPFPFLWPSLAARVEEQVNVLQTGLQKAHVLLASQVSLLQHVV